jgi:nucleoside-diphosphate-sugar epimerase
MKAWEETNRLRTEGAQALVEACLAENIEILISESIVFVYADGGERFLDENSPVDDAGIPMLQAALESEAQISKILVQGSRAMAQGSRAIVLRFGALYSPYDTGTLDMIGMMRKWMFPRIGPSRNYISPLYLDDAGSAIAAALNAPSGIYNVTDDEPLPLRDYLREMRTALHAPPPLPLPAAVGPAMFGEPWRYVSRSLRVSNAKFKQATGWSPYVRNAAQGWRQIAETLRSRRPRAIAASAREGSSLSGIPTHHPPRTPSGRS